MCGIAGCWSVRGEAAGGDVARMTRALAHRGPDDEGLLFWRRGSRVVVRATEQTVEPLRGSLGRADAELREGWHLAMGHRRFSILDITPGGHQPFVDGAGRAAVVFNGEIYNYVELRAELEQLGVSFRTHSDTEVLLAAYLQWGAEMFGRLNGMWAFALVDFRSGELLLSRDRAGEKPLFFAREGENLFFASEIRALFEIGSIRAARKADDARVLAYLCFGLRDHQAGSFFANVEQLAPGTWARVDASGKMSVQAYWKLPTRRLGTSEISFDEAAAGLAERLRASVELRLRADVPVASELSGGMDSTSIVALAAEHRRASGGEKLKAVTIRYEDRAFDESALALAAAEFCGVDAEALCLDSQDYWGVAEEMAAVQEQPYESPNLTGNRAMWRWMKERGIRVVLNGLGGDELLGGYIGWHLCPFFWELFLQGKWGAAAREWPHWGGHRDRSWVAMRRHFLRNMPGAAGRLYLKRMLSMPVFACLKLPGGAAADSLLHAGMRTGALTLGPYLQLDNDYAPLPMYLVIGDKLSMSLPVEVRYPFLDPEVMAFSFTLPVEYFFRDGMSKAVLRHAMRKHLPAEVLERREKMGFPVPLARWMNEGRERIGAELLANGSRMRRWLDGDRFVREFALWDPGLVWRVHQVETWMRLNDLAADD